MASGIRDFTVDFSPLATLPQLADQAQSREALRNLGSLDFSNPAAVEKVASSIFSYNPTVAIQLLQAANQRRAADVRAQFATPITFPDLGFSTGTAAAPATPSTAYPYATKPSTLDFKGQKLTIPGAESTAPAATTPATAPLNELPPSGDITPAGTSLFGQPSAVPLQQGEASAPWQVASAGQDIPFPQVAQATPAAGAPFTPPSGATPAIQTLQTRPAPVMGETPAVAAPAAPAAPTAGTGAIGEPVATPEQQRSALRAQNILRALKSLPPGRAESTVVASALTTMLRDAIAGARREPTPDEARYLTYVQQLPPGEKPLTAEQQRVQEKVQPEIFKGASDLTKEYRTLSSTSEREITLLNKVEQIAKSGKLVSGLGSQAYKGVGEAISSALGIARSIGVPAETVNSLATQAKGVTDAASASELLNSVINQITLARAGGRLGAQFSNVDLGFTIDISPNARMTEQGLLAVTRMNRAIAERNKELGDLADTYMRKMGGRADPAQLSALIREYNTANPLFARADGSRTDLGASIEKDYKAGLIKEPGPGNQGNPNLPGLLGNVAGTVLGGPFAPPNPPGAETLGGAIPPVSGTLGSALSNPIISNIAARYRAGTMPIGEVRNRLQELLRAAKPPVPGRHGNLPPAFPGMTPETFSEAFPSLGELMRSIIGTRR